MTKLRQQMIGKRQSNPSVRGLQLVLKWEDERRAGGENAAPPEPDGGRAVGRGIRGERVEPPAVCQERGLALATLDRYRKWRRQAGTEPGAGVGWVAVEVSTATPAAGNGASGLAVVLSRGRRIEVGRGFDTHTFGQLVRLLEQV